MFIYLDGKAWAQMQKEQKNSPNRLCRHRCPEEWRFSVLFKKTWENTWFVFKRKTKNIISFLLLRALKSLPRNGGAPSFRCLKPYYHFTVKPGPLKTLATEPRATNTNICTFLRTHIWLILQKHTYTKLIFGTPFASRLLDLSRSRVYFACATITIAKIRDYSQSNWNLKFPKSECCVTLLCNMSGPHL